MINSMQSPMSGFKLNLGGVGGPSMYEIGYNSSPGGSVANVIRNTIDKYHANLTAQQEQNYKLAQIKAQGDIGFGNDVRMYDYKQAAEQAAAQKIAELNNQLPNSGVRKVSVDGRDVFLQDRYDDKGVLSSHDVSPASLPTLENFAAQQAIESLKNGGVKSPLQDGINGSVPKAGGSMTTEEKIRALADMYNKERGSK